MSKRGSNKINYKEGQIVGQCIFLKESHTKIKGRQYLRYAFFKCSCGNEFIANITNVKSGNTNSCGCLQKKKARESNFKHGLKFVHKSEYNTWVILKQRCLNKKHPKYKDYGGRGILVCERWLNSFENFFSDMGNKPAKEYSIDRINNNGNYEPNNCRWATQKEQSVNTRSVNLLKYKDEINSLSQWARKFNISRRIIQYRLKKGWSTEKIFDTPVINNNARSV